MAIEKKHYMVECHGGGALGAPVGAVFAIDLEMAKFIIRMAGLVTANQLGSVERYTNDVAWAEDDFDGALPQMTVDGIDWQSPDLMGSEAERISVTGDDFQYRVYRKHCDEEIETDRLSIADLAEHFGLSFGDRLSQSDALMVFWRTSKTLEQFIADHCCGQTPVGIVLTSAQSIVVANGRRDSFYSLHGAGAQVSVLRTNDPINLVDPEAELECIGQFGTPEEAFQAVCGAEGWEIAA